MLEPMHPREAVNEYLSEVEAELAAATAQNYRYRLKKFLDWAEQAELGNMNDLHGNQLQAFKKDLMDDLAKITVKNHLSTTRKFVRYCEDRNVAPEGVSRKIRLPTIHKGEDVRDDHITQDEIAKILDFCEIYEFATLRHTAFYLLVETGLRSGALTGLDVRDYDAEHNIISVRHRPDEETPLKNKTQSERDVYLREHPDREYDPAEVLHHYLDQYHPFVDDKYGRIPLLGGNQGRLHYTTIQRNIYALTRPCHYTNKCPHDRVIQECEANSYNSASKCPSSVSPHVLRKRAATDLRKEEVPKDVAEERLNMTGEVLDKHYDKRTIREKTRARMRHLDRR